MPVPSLLRRLRFTALRSNASDSTAISSIGVALVLIAALGAAPSLGQELSAERALTERVLTERVLTERDGTTVPGWLTAWQATVPVRTDEPGGRRLASRRSTSSGVVTALDAAHRRLVVVTSDHGVACAPHCRIVIGLEEGSGFWVEVVARRAWSDPTHDMALLTAELPTTVNVTRLTVLPLPTGGAATTSHSDRVLALGFPTAPDETPGSTGPRRRVREGVFIARKPRFSAGYRASATGQDTGQLEGSAALLHTAPLTPGISGGPLVDTQGRWLGINTGSLVSTRDHRCARVDGPDSPCLSLSVGLDRLRPRVAELLRGP